MLGAIKSLRSSESGAISVLTALALPVAIGVMGLAAETSSWYLHYRAMQNAADAAAIAAAANGGANYATEAKAVAARYQFQDGAGNVTVTATNPATAPGCTAGCYVVTVADSVPVFLAPVAGYAGNVVVNGKGGTRLAATAVATKSGQHPYCILALAGSGAEGIHTNGAPKADLAGCDVMSNTTATCNGHDLNADIGDAHGTNDGCGNTANSGVAQVSDPYAGRASNIPANTCASYPQEPTKKNDPALPQTNQWSGYQNLSGNVIICGDLQLTGNTTINALDGAVLVIVNGQLDTNGYTLQATAGSALTIVFTGSNNASYQHVPTGGGTLDFAAPTSGPWSGIAIYQDPALTTNIDISAAGNSPTWKITGLVYLPHASVTFSGAVNKSSNGLSCFAMVVDNILINGTGSILAQGDCAAAGLSLPQGGVTRGMLAN